MNKKGNILMENVVFIILVVLFFSILFIFVYKQTSNVSLVEEKAAKNIALIIDSANPGTEIILNVNDILDKRADNFNERAIVIERNFVIVKLSAKSGHSYSYFNGAKVQYELQQGGFIKITVI